MSSKNYNILVLDPVYFKKSVIQDILVKSGFNVRVLTSIENASAAIETFNPDIIICRTSSRMTKDNSLMNSIHDEALRKRIPFLVISSGGDVDFYLRLLEKGISHSITTPFNSEFLVTRINDILHRHSIIADEKPVSIQFTHRNSDYALTIKLSQLVQFIISLVDDSVRHSSALSESIQKKNLLQQSISSQEIFDGIRVKPEPDTKLELELYKALDNGEFVLYYQPIMSLTQGRIAGFEALIRWNHPLRKIIGPDDFIPIAERLPLIIPLGFWIIEEVSKQLRTWESTFHIDPPILIGVNLSANQFNNPDLSSAIKQILGKYGIAPESISFEITESAFLTDMESANIQLLKLKSNSHPICMDDFGTGYSSLSYLQHFPVDTLKIDQSFVRWMHIDDQSKQIVHSVVGLAHNLGMKVVAEGIEEESHLQMLKDLKCDFGQGFYFSGPMKATDAEEYLQKFYRKKS
jgi:EAL domain-containing protein (putative c-di-GMP-specific phosphodiesterase class I)/CheY-like chemotaxis protein